MAREIPLTQGFVAIVDDDCFDWLNQWTWRAVAPDGSTVYAVRTGRRVQADPQCTVYMHRIVFGAGPREMIDHANRNSLDNRRENLRYCTPSGNIANRVQPVGVSGYRGVYPSGRKWMARIEWQNARHYLGKYADPVVAARAYDEAARRIHGEFAILNFPEAQHV